MIYIEPEILERVNRWMSPVFDGETQQRIKEQIAHDPKGLTDSFYKNLAFGTGGMRGIMGDGDNRINRYTLGKNTEGLSLYLKEQFPGEDLKVAIAYDCRHNSEELAQVVANVFSANDIDVFLFSEPRPTPALSFAVRHLGCHCGIVLTASHNPPEYNGYKVYWQDGGQLVPPHDVAVIEKIDSLDYGDINFAAQEDRIQLIDREVDEAFISASIKNGSFDTPGKARESLSIVFTPLHGTAIALIPEVLKKTGYTQVHIVEEQATPDGDFPTVPSPNPEEPAALEMALSLAENVGADIVIGTDPDTDRLGIAVRDDKGKLTLLNGNQAMVLMTDFLLGATSNEGAFVASTIVSTPMMQKLADHYGVKCRLGLTGFKWIAKMIRDYPEETFIGGGEESFGYLVGDFVRDKDAVTATLLACEIAAQAKAAGSSAWERMLELYLTHGLCREHLVSLVKKGREGAEDINRIMRELRENPPGIIGGEQVISVKDYQKGIDGLPKSNVLGLETDRNSRVFARPSGTEPKIKFYISVSSPLKDKSDYDRVCRALDNKIKVLISEIVPDKT